MNFRSTRGLESSIKGSEAIINGIAKDGGLYVPETFPKMYEKLRDKSIFGYEEIAVEIIYKYFNDISKESIRKAVKKAYRNRFKVNVNNGYLELYHGPTCAFKDAALLFLPQIMKEAKKNLGLEDEIVILTATSGDTGKAALEGFKDIDGFKVLVYYPKDGVSEIQRKQMETSEGGNLKVVAIKGNFDNAQSGVKDIFNDNNLNVSIKERGITLSSANSINIGRLIPQIVYYFYSYFKLIDKGEIKRDEEINIAVPTGNFGNILAAYYAKKMGLPINKFICASNKNNVLSDFFNSGIYDKNRELYLTESPSMDILISSNLERLLFEATGRDSFEVRRLMDSLKANGIYKISEKLKSSLGEFYGGYANEEEVYKEIKKVYVNDGYLIDTHTAVASVVKDKYKNETKDDKYILTVSTASPYKFPRSICSALGIDVEFMSDYDVLKALFLESSSEIPACLSRLQNKKELHNNLCDKDNMKEALIDFLDE
ncbi:threonine synthase [Clostridium chrysemydis]|uniref:threonine synthase n=1 Tax=Clostridium chrysemydis TaxID=2665504 RepID=UPI00188388E6|nr:threonine synthase [Clostridium chrysemydis]